MEVFNFDQLIGDEQKFINRNILAPQWPFRLLIIGPSGCGKTNLLLNLITDYLVFNKIYIYAKDLDEPKYQFLQEFFDNVEECLKEKHNIDINIAEFSNLKDDIINVDDLDPDYQNLIVFDDFLSEKDQTLIEDLFIRGRKKNCSLIYLTQSYFSTPKDIRLQCNYFIIYQIANKREVNEILSDICIDLDKEKFIKFYSQSIKDKYNFFMIDLKDKNKKYRKNFDKILF